MRGYYYIYNRSCHMSSIQPSTINANAINQQIEAGIAALNRKTNIRFLCAAALCAALWTAFFIWGAPAIGAYAATSIGKAKLVCSIMGVQFNVAIFLFARVFCCSDHRSKVTKDVLAKNMEEPKIPGSEDKSVDLQVLNQKHSEDRYRYMIPESAAMRRGEKRGQ